MSKFKVELVRVEYLSEVIEIEAEDQKQAMDKAWDLSGNWKCVDAEEFTNNVERI